MIPFFKEQSAQQLRMGQGYHHPGFGKALPGWFIWLSDCSGER